ncbi:MAG TPA: fibrillarin-like rRNA/tRNA 2'-O-methyltransferase [Nitrososphaerales archaeon]|nr:fibrillarin-like rRNA/tRNA 2'-O-methyltransferase [Nitrososphaerales archaeon]
MTRLRAEERGGKAVLMTKNLVPGNRTYGEEVMIKDGSEFRVWDPFRSKLAAAILKGLPQDVVKEGEKVLYLGTSTGTTPSHVSDLVGPEGLVIGVELAPRVAREFVENVARKRSNVVPFVADARDPSKYSLTKVDTVYCDIAQQDQTEIAVANCRRLLKEGGKLLLVVKARSIDVLKDPKVVFREETSKLEAAGFKVVSVIELSPFDKDHALILATGSR